MSKPDAVFIFIGTYPTESEAWVDYREIEDLHAIGAVGICEAAAEVG